MKTVRIILAVALALMAALFLAVTLTAPAIAATAPAILTLGFAAGAWFAWPKRKNTVTA